jgi:hypothetical protein
MAPSADLPATPANLDSQRPIDRRAQIVPKRIGRGVTRFEVTFLDVHARPMYPTGNQVHATWDGLPDALRPLPPATDATIEAQNRHLPASEQYTKARYDHWVYVGYSKVVGSHTLIVHAKADGVQAWDSTTSRTSVMQAREATFYGPPMLAPWPPTC